MTDYVCEECREGGSEDATVCPHCGYNPSAKIERQAKWRLGIGALLCFTIIGGIIGIPLVISGFRHSKRGESATLGVPA